MSLITRTDVTAVKLYQSYILAGIGSNIEMYKRDSGKFIQKIPVLRGQKIYGIVPYSLDSKLLIFGGKQFKILTCKAEPIETDDDLVLEHNMEARVCDDWLHSGVWMTKSKVAFLTAHNVVQVWNTKNKLLEKQYASPYNSILYSGLLLPLQDELLVFSGTVFSEVIVQWCGDDQALQYLKGHKGVIFSITCDPVKGIIVTSSDDRSLRIWSITSPTNFEYTSKNYWQKADIVCTHELYGHTARVMRNCITSDYIISIGEDSGVCFWNLEGKLLRKVVSHQNACILWSLDANDKYLVTGGGDSGVIIHPMSLLTEYCNSGIVKINIGSVKKVAFTARGNIVILNDNDLIYYDLKSKTNEVHNLNHKSTYKLLGLSACKQIIAIVDMTGKLDVFIENCKGDVGIKNIIDTELNLGNILSMQWANNRHIVICSDSGQITVIASKESSIEEFANFILPHCKERWLTSSTLNDNNKVLVVSDRNGRIHIYLRGNKNPLKTFDKVHGRYGATSIKISNNQIISTGRDGTIKYFSMNKSTNEIKYMNSKDLEFQWLEKFLDKNESYICGFQERIFAVYDIKNNIKILEVNCGGGHRPWDAVRHFEKVNDNFEEFIKLVYLKNSEIHLESFQLSKIVSRNIINGTHSKEINCLKTHVFNNDRKTIFHISGGEDTSLRISRSSLDTKFRDEIVFKQLSSIRTLKLLLLEENKILLVSAGGRAQICAKIVMLNDNNNIISEEIFDYLIKGTDKERKGNRSWKDCLIDFDPETRIMDLSILKIDESNFLIITGCSDGILRVFKLENGSKVDFKLITEIKHHKTCILKTHTFKLSNKNILATATTRGNVAFWDIKSNFTDFDVIFEMETNKSGINSIDVKVISETQFLMATGGDDNAIHLNVLKIADDLKSMKVHHNWSSDKYHCSQITGLKLINDLMVTTSIDQRLTLFKLTIENNIDCEFISQSFSDVADIQGIDILSFSKDSIKVCVFGKGVEVLQLSCSKNIES